MSEQDKTNEWDSLWKTPLECFEHQLVILVYQLAFTIFIIVVLDYTLDSDSFMKCSIKGLCAKVQAKPRTTKMRGEGEHNWNILVYYEVIG